MPSSSALSRVLSLGVRGWFDHRLCFGAVGVWFSLCGSPHAESVRDAVNSLTIGETPFSVHQMLNIDTPNYTRVFPACAIGRLLLGQRCMVENYATLNGQSMLVLFYQRDADVWRLAEWDLVVKNPDGSWDLSDLGISSR